MAVRADCIFNIQRFCWSGNALRHYRPAQGRSIELRANLPREDSGKLFKRRLRDPYWEGVRRKI